MRASCPSDKEGAETRVITCADGVTICAVTEEELLAKAEAHMQAAHPELAGRLSREEILRAARISPVPADSVRESGDEGGPRELEKGRPE